MKFKAVHKDVDFGNGCKIVTTTQTLSGKVITFTDCNGLELPFTFILVNKGKIGNIYEYSTGMPLGHYMDSNYLVHSLRYYFKSNTVEKVRMHIDKWDKINF